MLLFPVFTSIVIYVIIIIFIIVVIIIFISKIMNIINITTIIILNIDIISIIAIIINSAIGIIFTFFMNGNAERAQCAFSRVCIPYEKEKKTNKDNKTNL